jgi:hypothetical protein
MSIGQELLNVPMGDMIRQMALAIADGQTALDAASVETAEMMGGLKAISDASGNTTFTDSRVYFGYEMMTLDQAMAYIIVDRALSGATAAEKETKAVAALKEVGNQTTINPAPATIGAAAPQTDKDKYKADLQAYYSQKVRVPIRLSMLELGFTPTFYQFVDTIIEVKIAIKITSGFDFTQTVSQGNAATSSANRSGGLLGVIFGGSSSNSSVVSTSQVDATYASKYSYSAEGASLLRTKIVPLPPPPILEERIRRQMNEEFERRKKDIEVAPTPLPSP